MGTPTARQRIWGWYAFDWASQPYFTLLLTFSFAPYVNVLVGDGVRAQSLWGFTIGAVAIVIALSAPILGAVADQGARRLPWVWVFSILIVLSSATLWGAAPGTPHLYWYLAAFALGLLAVEYATIFTNAMLPSLGAREDLGAYSGTGTAIGYLGGLISLILMLTLLYDSEGKTLLGIDPILGLDPETREGTRAVGPLTAIWYIVFMVPFFLWVREPKPHNPVPIGQAAKRALPELGQTLRALPKTPSLFSFLAASMFYRDALFGLYGFGGIYAVGVLGWSEQDVGIFGIIAIISAGVFAWVGGQADKRIGPLPVIWICVLVLTAITIAVVSVSREAVLFLPVAPDSTLPDITFYVLGAGIGAAGGVLQAASRTLMCRQAGEVSLTQAFGLYALAGKATAFLAPTTIGIVTAATGSQTWGITPLVGLFLLGLILLRWVHPDGDAR